MRRTSPTPIGDILKEFFSRPYVAAKVAEGRLPEYWRMVVGDHIADMTTEFRLERHVLHVRVSSSVVRQELFFRRDELMIRLNEMAGVRLIGAVIIR